MSFTTSEQRLILFDPLPDLHFVDAQGETVAVRDGRDAPALVVGFVDPTSAACRRIHGALGDLAREYRRRGVVTLIVNPTADGESEEAKATMRRVAEDAAWSCPYVVDADQSVTRLFGVRRVPDFFIFDRDRRLAYHGRFDAELPEVPSDGEDLRDGLETILRNESPLIGRPTKGDPVQWRSRPPRAASPVSAR